MRNFEELDVWKKGCRLAVKVYGMLKDCRDFGLKDQMTRAAVSISSNIAEGSERRTDKEFVNFLFIAKGSAAELRTQVYIAEIIGILSKEQRQELVNDTKEIGRLLFGLIRSINAD